MIAIRENCILRYSNFSGFEGFLGLKMANIGPFGLKIGFPINIDLNDGQKVHMCKVVAKIPNIWPKIGQLPLGHKDFGWA